MPIELQTISAEDVTTLKARAAVLLEDMSEKRLMATLVYMLWCIYGDAGEDVDISALLTNTATLEGQMSEAELKAALIYSLWSSPGA